MLISESLLLFVSGFGFIQAVVLSCVLFFHKRADRTVTPFLALYIACLGVPLLAPILMKLITWQTVTWVEPFILLIGPMLYLYVRSFKDRITWKVAWPHCILFVAAEIVATVMYFRFIDKYAGTPSPPEDVIWGPIMLVRSGVRVLHLVIYYFLARHALTRYQSSIQNIYSDTSRINLSWVRWLINGHLILTIALTLILVLILTDPDHFRFYLLLNTAIATPYIYISAYKGLTQPTIWQLKPNTTQEKVREQLHEMEAIKPGAQQVETKAVRSDAQKEKADEIVQKTIALMEEEKLYQEPELSIQQLAEKLQHPTYLVSLAINNHLGKSFYDLVNGYRVEEAKRLLLDPRNRTYKVLSVGFEAGFNSKTTFNTVFKKYTGLSPTEYREKNLHAPVMI